MHTPEHWHNSLNNNRHDGKWFRKHISALFEDCENAVNNHWNYPINAGYRANYVSVIIEVIPRIDTHFEAKRWLDLCYRAREVFDIENTRLYVQLSTSIGKLHHFLNQIEKAVEAYTAAFTVARELDDPISEILAMIGLIELGHFSQHVEIYHDDIEIVLSYKPHYRTQDITMRLYVAAANLFMQWNIYERAIRFAQMAHGLAVDVGDKFYIGTSAYILSVCSLHKHDFIEAEKWREIAADFLSETAFAWQYATMTYQVASNLMYKKQYEEAVHWMHIALRDILSAGSEQKEAGIKHGLGVALIYTDELDKSRLYLLEAQAFEDQFGPSANQVHVRHSLAYRSYRAGDKADALHWYNEGRHMIPNILSPGIRQKMIERYELLNNQISRLQ